VVDEHVTNGPGSLYSQVSRPARGGERKGETIETAKVETIDNDVLAVTLPVLVGGQR
jgi:hypothetical protein